MEEALGESTCLVSRSEISMQRTYAVYTAAGRFAWKSSSSCAFRVLASVTRQPFSKKDQASSRNLGLTRPSTSLWGLETHRPAEKNARSTLENVSLVRVRMTARLRCSAHMLLFFFFTVRLSVSLSGAPLSSARRYATDSIDWAVDEDRCWTN